MQEDVDFVAATGEEKVSLYQMPETVISGLYSCNFIFLALSKVFC